MDDIYHLNENDFTQTFTILFLRVTNDTGDLDDKFHVTWTRRRIRKRKTTTKKALNPNIENNPESKTPSRDEKNRL